MIHTHGWIGTETIRSRFGDFAFKNGYPTDQAARKLYELRTFSRAIECYLSQLPAVSMFCVRRGLREFGADAVNTFVIFESLIDARSLFLTGNTEVIYGTSFLDLKRDGATVLETPMMLAASATDMWMRDIADVEPGRLLFVPPGEHGVARDGYLVVPSPTFGVWITVRGLRDRDSHDRAVALMKTTKIYPMIEASDPPPMRYLNGSGKPIDTIFPDTYEFFEDLAEVIAQEPAGAVSPADRFMLASIGIENGKPFNPDAETKALLAEAARVGAAMARTNRFASRDPDALVYPDRHWERAVPGGSPTWDTRGYINSDHRAAWSYAATSDSPAESLVTTRDARGVFLDGGRSYRLHLPPNIPAALFWSVVVYDNLSRSELQNGGRFPSVSQYTGPALNDDGSVDVYFGPTAPADKDRNWIRTLHGRGWFPYLRLHSPTQAFFDKTWKPGDIEETKTP